MMTECKKMLKPLSDMTMLLTKMIIQCKDFQSYSISTQVLACIRAANTLIKSSQATQSDSAQNFCYLIQKILDNILETE